MCVCVRINTNNLYTASSFLLMTTKRCQPCDRHDENALIEKENCQTKGTDYSEVLLVGKGESLVTEFTPNKILLWGSQDIFQVTTEKEESLRTKPHSVFKGIVHQL